MNQNENKNSALRDWKTQAENKINIECNHDCRIACKMLNDAMRRETQMIQFYEQLQAECDYPDINAFMRELLEDKSRLILKINQKLNELRARGQVSQNIISSFEPD